MTVEDFVRSSIREYPTLYFVKNQPEISKHRVLHHAFYVNGNGVDWHDGYMYEPKGYRREDGEWEWREIKPYDPVTHEDPIDFENSKIIELRRRGVDRWSKEYFRNNTVLHVLLEPNKDIDLKEDEYDASDYRDLVNPHPHIFRSPYPCSKGFMDIENIEPHEMQNDWREAAKEHTQFLLNQFNNSQFLDVFRGTLLNRLEVNKRVDPSDYQKIITETILNHIENYIRILKKF